MNRQGRLILGHSLFHIILAMAAVSEKACKHSTTMPLLHITLSIKYHVTADLEKALYEMIIVNG